MIVHSAHRLTYYNDINFQIKGRIRSDGFLRIFTVAFLPFIRKCENAKKHATSLPWPQFSHTCFDGPRLGAQAVSLTQSLWDSSLASSFQWPSSPCLHTFTRLSQPPDTNLMLVILIKLALNIEKIRQIMSNVAKLYDTIHK